MPEEYKDQYPIGPYSTGQVWQKIHDNMDDTNLTLFCESGSWEATLKRRTWSTWPNYGSYNPRTPNPRQVVFGNGPMAGYSNTPWLLARPGEWISLYFQRPFANFDGDFWLYLEAKSPNSVINLDWVSKDV